MIEAIIIDDEQHCIDRLTDLLNIHHKNSVKLLGTFKTVDDGIKAIKELNPELVFLDVQINERTGFELLQQFNNIGFKLIFTTAYDRFAVQAIKFSAIDYLLKPIDADDLQAALTKVKDILSITDMQHMIKVLSRNITGPSKQKTITVPSGNELVFLNTEEIIRCESDVNYTSIFIANRPKLVVAKTLKEFEELLVDYNFFRVHNSHLINLSYIKSYNKGKGGSVVLKDNTEIEVSTRRKDEFLKKLEAL